MIIIIITLAIWDEVIPFTCRCRKRHPCYSFVPTGWLKCTSGISKLNTPAGTNVPQFTELTAGCSWPLMLTVRKGELVERRLSHSLGLGSGSDSMKLLLSSLMLVWWRMISVWVLSTSFNNNVQVRTVRYRGMWSQKKTKQKNWGQKMKRQKSTKQR